MDSVTSTENEVEIFRRKEWSNVMTKMLITLYKELSPKVGRNKEMPTCKKLYAKIAHIMTKRGYELTPAQIRAKWVSLARSYKDVSVRRGNKQTVQKQKVCLYQTELYDIFKDKNTIIPKIMVKQTEIVQELGVVESVSRVDEYEDDVEDSFEVNIKRKTRASLIWMFKIFTRQCERHHRDTMSLLRSMMTQRKEIAEQRSKDRRELIDFLKQKR